jgi:hypothetical protein
MHVAALWRYPVKSMAGERLDECWLGPEGIPGDRLVQVRSGRGRVVTSRSKPRLLLLRATLGEDGVARVDGARWDDPEVARKVAEAAGEGAHLVRDESLDRFDVLPLLVATDGAIDTLGSDVRRFRPNVLVGGVEGFAERDWPGRRLAIGDTVVELAQLRERCIMTTFDPDDARQDVSVLKTIHFALDGTLALDASVVRPGPIKLGDPVVLLR